MAKAPMDRASALALVDQEIEELRTAHPCHTFIPNIGQERVFKHYERPKANGEYPYIVISSAGNGMGKDQACSLIIPTPNGYRRWGDLVPGDEIWGTAGNPTKITAVFPQGVKKQYRVTFDDGSSTLAGADHLWTVKGRPERRYKKGWTTITTMEIVKRGVKHKNGSLGGARQFEIPGYKAVQYKAKSPIDGYLMGCWLGDGSCSSAAITKNDPEIFDELRRRGFLITKRKTPERADTYYVLGGVLKPYLGGKGHEKRVPPDFLLSMVSDRLDLLRGIMDTDGTADKNGRASFSTSSPGLAEDVCELVRSLGGRAKFRPLAKTPTFKYKGEKKTGRPSYTVMVTTEFNPFFLPRKAKRWLPASQERYLTRWIDKIEEAGEEASMCVTVDAEDALYLTNQYIVTHNTAMLAVLLTGCCFGLEELSDFFRGYRFFGSLHDKWRARGLNRPLHFRIICEASDMMESGELYMTLRAWLPRGRYTMSKGGEKWYSSIICDNGVEVDVRTHEQATSAHASANLDGIFCNEPYPQKHHAEIVGRTRGGAFFFMAMTPDKTQSWMNDQFYDVADEENLIVEYGSTFDNCRDIPGTRGHLARVAIERMIREWEKEGPDVLEARLNGKPPSAVGKIYALFSEVVHVIPPPLILPEAPVYCIIDPHDAKPPAVAWFMQVSNHESVAVAEWPTDPYEKLTTNKYTIAQVCRIIRDIERTMFRPGQVAYRFMDPNKGRTPYANTQRTVQDEYLVAGLEFLLSEDNMEVGHGRVQDALSYNPGAPVEAPNVPVLRFSRACQNLIRAMSRYAMKKNAYPLASTYSRVDQKYKDFADLVRYFIMRLQIYEAVSRRLESQNSIYAGRVDKPPE